MWTDSSFNEDLVELDADRPLERVLLSTQFGQWELAFFSESSDGHYWQIVEVLSSGNASTPHREVVRFLNLEKNAVIPLGTLPNSQAENWNMVIVYDKGQRVYPLLNETEASKFQRLITGYKLCERYSSVACAVICKRRRLSLSIRDEEDAGIGEIQLWEWPEILADTNRPPPPPSRSVYTAQPCGSIATTVRTISGTRGGTVLQTTGARELLISSITPAPVLVLFIHDRGVHKMMKVDITELEFRLSESRIDLFTHMSRAFDLERLSVKNSEQYNLCAMRPTFNSPETEKTKCTFVSLEFQNPGIAADFINSLLRLQLSHKEIERERSGVQASVRNNTLPLSAQPNSPMYQGTDTASLSSFVSLPRIPSIKPLEDTLWRVDGDRQKAAILRHTSIIHQQIPELETSRPEREVYSPELTKRFELPERDSSNFGLAFPENKLWLNPHPG